MKAAAPLPRLAVAGYALGSLGSRVYSTVQTVLLLYFCTEVLATAPEVAAAMSLAVALACGGAMLLAWYVVRGRDRPLASHTPLVGGLRGAVARVLRHPGYLRLWLCYLFATSGVALFLALSPYFVTRVLGRGEGDAGTALLALLAGTVLAVPAWGLALRRFDVWRTFLAASLAFALVGYDAGSATQSAESLGGLTSLMVLGPAVLMLPCVLMIVTRPLLPTVRHAT